MNFYTEVFKRESSDMAQQWQLRVKYKGKKKRKILNLKKIKTKTSEVL